MSFELLTVDCPAGGDLEDAAEALTVRRDNSLPLGRTTDVSERARAELATAALAADPLLVRVEAPDGLACLADGAGVTVEIGDHHVFTRIAYDARAEDTWPVFERVFRVLRSVTAATSWRTYDPQSVREIALDDDESRATHELYESVLDQLHPADRPTRRFQAGDSSTAASAG